MWRTVFDAKRAIADGEHSAVRHHDRIGNGAAVENGLTAAAQILQDDLREWNGGGDVVGAQMGGRVADGGFRIHETTMREHDSMPPRANTVRP